MATKGKTSSCTAFSDKETDCCKVIAVVSVDERGTEAAAATAVIMTLEAMPPPKPTFRADHPFLFAIQENESGTILFMGRVSDPTAE